MLRCEYCDEIVEDLANHLISAHELDGPTALAVTQDRPVQILLDPGHPGQNSSSNRAPSKRASQQQMQVTLHCNVCEKDFASQRDFTNHRRRKDFCKPIYDPAVELAKIGKRRVGKECRSRWSPYH